MKIDFRLLDETVLPKFKGGEKQLLQKMFTDERNRIMKAKLEPGASIGLHTHDTSSEIIYVLSGKGKAVCKWICGTSGSRRPPLLPERGDPYAHQ